MNIEIYCAFTTTVNNQNSVLMGGTRREREEDDRRNKKEKIKSKNIRKDKKESIEKLPFKKVYNIDLPAFIVKGLLEKNGVKEDPKSIQLKIVLKKKKD